MGDDIKAIIFVVFVLVLAGFGAGYYIYTQESAPDTSNIAVPNDCLPCDECPPGEESETIWKVIRCSPKSDVCKMGSFTFKSKESCEDFAIMARASQPDVGRDCFRVVK